MRCAPDMTTVECEYCHTRSVVQKRTRMLQMPVKVSGAERGPVAVQVAHRGSLLGVLLVVVIGALAIGFVVTKAADAVNNVARGKDTLRWTGMGPAVFADVDGDGQADPIGLVRYVLDGDRAHLAAFSSHSGKRLWQSERLGRYTDTHQGVVAVMGDRLLFGDPRASLRVYSIADGKALFRAALSDKVKTMCRLDERHIAIESKDKVWQSVAIANGERALIAAPGQCQPLPQSRAHTSVSNRDDRLQLDGMSVVRQLRSDDGSVTIGFGRKQPGSPVPMLARLDGTTPRWTQPVPAVDPLTVTRLDEDLVTLSPERICAVYQPNSVPPRLTCFMLVDGARAWDTEIKQGTTIVMRGLSAVEGRLYLSSWGHLQVFDEATGKHLRTIGQL